MNTLYEKDYDYALDRDWCARMFCELVKQLWQKMQDEGKLSPQYHLHLPKTFEDMNEMMNLLSELQVAVLTRCDGGGFTLGCVGFLEVLVAAWTGLGQRSMEKLHSPFAYSQRSNHLLWFLQHFEKNGELLYREVDVSFLPCMLNDILKDLRLPCGLPLTPVE